MIQTSRRAFEFALNVTGQKASPIDESGKDKECVKDKERGGGGEPGKDGECGGAKEYVERKERVGGKESAESGDGVGMKAVDIYSLDYSRFRDVVDSDEEKEKVPEAADTAKQIARMAMGEEEAPVDEDVEGGNTSEFFDIQKSAAMQGCAHDRSKERAMYERPNPEKMQMATRHRYEGNEEFKKKNFGRASAYYLRALVQLEYTFPEGEAELKEYDELKKVCHLNLAASKFNQDELSECYNQCAQALRLDPQNAKARFRQGQCHLRWFEYGKAREAFENCRVLKGTDAKMLRDIEAALAVVSHEEIDDKKSCLKFPLPR